MLGQAILNSIRRWLKDPDRTYDEAMLEIRRLVKHADADEKYIHRLESDRSDLLREAERVIAALAGSGFPQITGDLQSVVNQARGL